MRTTCLIFLFFFIAACSEDELQPEAKVFTSDIELFVAAQNKIAAGEDPVTAFQGYIDKGSSGVKDFIEYRIISAEKLAETVAENPDIYSQISVVKTRIPEIKAAVVEIFRGMKKLYPETRLPEVYFLVGRMNSGGTASDNGIMIGVEVFLNTLEIYPYIVAHEMIHFQQNNPSLDVKDTLLGQTIKEGSADFIGELISGGMVNDKAHAYGLLHECQLWKEFQQIMDGTDLAGWLYGKPEGLSEYWYERPNDLGYFMGYRITQSYYEKAKDKKAAIAEILNIKDFEGFLEKSGYPAKMAFCELG